MLRWTLVLSLMLNHVVLLPVAYVLFSGRKDPPKPPVEVDLVDPGELKKKKQAQPQPDQKKSPLKKVRLAKLQRPRLRPPERPKPPPKKKLEKKKKKQQKKAAVQQPNPLQPLPRLKMVEVNNPETKEAQKNARFLSDKNRKVLRETRARLTNLVRDAKRPKPITEKTREKNPGAKKKKIAELDKQRAKKPSDKKQSQQQKVSPLLAMRSPPRKQQKALTAIEKRKALAERANGDLQPERKAQRARPRLSLTHQDFDRIFGKKAQKQRELARLQPSKRRGSKHARRWKRVQAALENFVPEVQPGNQTALGTRAHPFAVYIARMHRKIHKLWGFGFLVDLESKPDSHPFNDMKLWTMVEVVVAPNGKVAKATVIKPSGQLAFDVAALNTVFTAGPFPRPPKAIRSKDGRVYMHWRFHRNHRQCGTFGVDPYILTKPPKGPIDSNLAEVGRGGSGGATARSRRRLNRAPHGGGGGGGGGGRQARLGQPFQPHKHAGTQRRRQQQRKLTKAQMRARAKQAKRAAARRVRANDPVARQVARRFLRALARTDAKSMAAQCALPFYSRGKKIATSAAQLTRMFGDLTRESRGAIGPLELMTVMQARQKLGYAPRGARYGAQMLVGRVKIGGVTSTMLLQRRDKVWHVIGLSR